MNAPTIQNERGPELLKLSDIRRICGCSRSHLYKIRTGRFPNMPPLPVIPFGRTFRVRREAFTAWLRLLEARERELQRASGVCAAWPENDPERMTGV